MRARLSRREFLTVGAAAAALAMRETQSRPQLAVTMDDFNVLEDIHLTGAERSERMLAALRRHGTQAMALVIGHNAETPVGRTILDGWAAAGHVIGNHTYSHRDYHNASTTAKAYVADFERGDEVLRGRRGFEKFFRFPMLREGDTTEKRDAMRRALAARGYRNAYVTIDNSDFLVAAELRDRLVADPRTDPRPYRDIYLRHMLAFARYFRDAAREVFGRDIPHTLLTHFNLLSALYLGDLLDALRDDGWSIARVSAVYEDDVFLRQPDVLPAGDSLVWACAQEMRRGLPRAPVENDAWLHREFAALRTPR
jgi:peptidoglycan/xylan/chitin deacetylase (PgdA/CDA1 family)